MSADIQIKSLPGELVLAAPVVATTDTVKERMEEAFGVLMRHVGMTGAQVVGPPFTQYGEPIEGEFAFSVCVPVAPGAVAGAGVGLEELPAVEAAALLFMGSYDAMEPAWHRLIEWVAEADRKPGGPLREVYLNDPGQVPPDEVMTELLVPLG